MSATQWATESHGRSLSKRIAGSNPSFEKTRIGRGGGVLWRIDGSEERNINRE